MTNNIAAARQYLLDQHNGMFPDIEMGPYKNKQDAVNYIRFMQSRFPGTKEVILPEFSDVSEEGKKWWVFSFELVGPVQ